MKNSLLRHGFYLVLIIAMAWWILYGQAIFRPAAQPAPITRWKTKIEYLDRPAPAVKLSAPQVAPKKLQVYTRPDTLKRQAMEAGPLISGVQLQRRQLQVHTISALGIGQVSSFPLKDLPLKAITIDSVGQVNLEVDQKEVRRQHRRKVWRKIGNGAITTAAFVLGLLL